SGAVPPVTTTDTVRVSAATDLIDWEQRPALQRPLRSDRSTGVTVTRTVLADRTGLATVRIDDGDTGDVQLAADELRSHLGEAATAATATAITIWVGEVARRRFGHL